MKKRILIVDDEPGITMGLMDQLEAEGFEVEARTDGESALKTILEAPPDLVLLDVMLPKMDGFEICRELNRRGVRVPIIILTARGQEFDKVLGLELGADDYVTKPFAVREIAARIRAVLRRVAPRAPLPLVDKLSFDDIEVDFKKFEARKGGSLVKLTPREIRMLQCFAQRPGEVISREEFLDQIWGEEVYVSSRSVDNQIWSLRNKLDDPEDPKHFISIRGVGYRFIPEPQAES